LCDGSGRDGDPHPTPINTCVNGGKQTVLVKHSGGCRGIARH
jgi:hypothetical protein